MAPPPPPKSFKLSSSEEITLDGVVQCTEPTTNSVGRWGPKKNVEITFEPICRNDWFRAVNFSERPKSTESWHVYDSLTVDLVPVLFKSGPVRTNREKERERSRIARTHTHTQRAGHMLPAGESKANSSNKILASSLRLLSHSLASESECHKTIEKTRALLQSSPLRRPGRTRMSDSETKKKPWTVVFFPIYQRTLCRRLFHSHGAVDDGQRNR